MEQFAQSLNYVVPWLVAATALLGLWFQRGRAARAGVMFGVIWLMASVWPESLSMRYESRLDDALSVWIPLDLLLLAMLPTAGIFRWSSLLFWGIVFAQSSALFWLGDESWRMFMALVGGPWVTPLQTPLGPLLPGVIALLLGGVISLARWVLHANSVDCGLALALTFCALALDRHFDGRDISALLAAASLSMILALIYAAWRMAYTDRLTGLPSRRALEQALRQSGRKYALGMVDIDHFKRINDRFGHPFGDHVLRAVASCLHSVPNAVAYRYGGEEFCLLFRGRSCAGARDALEDVREKIAARPVVLRSKYRPTSKPAKREPYRRKVGKVNVTVSIGMAERLKSESSDEVLDRADKALYRAKQQGRDRLVLA